MSLNLYMDYNVRREITEGLRARGIDVLTAYEDGAATLSDPDLLDRASSLGRFLAPAAQAQEAQDQAGDGDPSAGDLGAARGADPDDPQDDRREPRKERDASQDAIVEKRPAPTIEFVTRTYTFS